MNEVHSYNRYWTVALTRLLGWPKDQIDAWAEKWSKDLRRNDGLFHHERPGWYIVNLFIPADVADNLSVAQLNYARSCVEHLLYEAIPLDVEGEFIPRMSRDTFGAELEKCLEAAKVARS